MMIGSVLTSSWASWAKHAAAASRRSRLWGWDEDNGPAGWLRSQCSGLSCGLWGV